MPLISRKNFSASVFGSFSFAASAVRSARRCSGVDAMNVLPFVCCDSASTALIPERQRCGGSFSNDSAMRASMNAATPAARAPPDCLSVGVIMSLSSSTSAYSAATLHVCRAYHPAHLLAERLCCLVKEFWLRRKGRQPLQDRRRRRGRGRRF